MKTENVKFNGNDLTCIVTDTGEILVVMKPVCDALGLDSEWHIRSLGDDDVLGAERCEHTVQIGNDQARRMICLPLEFLHGWLFQVKFTNTMSDETKERLITFKRRCYSVLSNHFFGNLRKQIETNEMEIKLLEELNELNTKKNDVTSVIRDKKALLDKIRADRLNNEPTLF